MLEELIHADFPLVMDPAVSSDTDHFSVWSIAELESTTPTSKIRLKVRFVTL